MNKTIIYLIGKAGSGKTSASKYLQETYDFTPYTFSDAIRTYAIEHGLPLNERADYARAHTQIIKEHGLEYMVNQALTLPNNRICLDGVRSQAYANLIRKAGGKSIAFDCPADVRFSRVSSSADTAKYPSTLEAFIQSEQDDSAAIVGSGITFETDELISKADYKIDASRPHAEVLAQLGAIVESSFDSAQK